ncbi:MAG: beta-lactamase family protein [Proteobacteria bacterium]|nr:beta-lactamase family protein [Pseudomonadota bacterium]
MTDAPRKSIFLMIVWSALVLLPMLVAAGNPEPSVPPSPPSSIAPAPASSAAASATVGKPAAAASAIDPAALAAFVDGVVRAYMTEKGIAGVTVAVTSRDHSLLQRGYGVASLDPRREVDPDSTLFRLGSISKTFTYVATMQLVAAGKLDLDAPVDRYLPPSLKTDDKHYPPIRIWHLMTHTAGFEDAALSAHLFYGSPQGVPSLDAYLARYKPKRVRVPGLHADYSNYSVVLLGAIVQQVSGEPFDAYVERHILVPLGMRHTTFREPLAAGDPRRPPADMVPDWSEGFRFVDGGFAKQGFEYISNGAPAGAGSSDAADMARWMRMLLHGGALNGVQVLDPVTFREMVTPTWDNAPAVHAIAHGFFVGRYGRYTSLEHGGDTIWFHSNMVVLPQAGIGVFVSTNTDTGSALADALPRLIFEQFVQGARAPYAPAPSTDFRKIADTYSGTWLSGRRNYSTLEKGLSLDILKTSITSDGHLVASANGQSRQFVDVGRDVFRSIDDSDRIQFLRDRRGRITGLASAYGHVVYDRANALDNPFTLLAALALLALICACALIGAWGRRGRPARGGQARGREGRAPARSFLLAVFGWILFFLVVAVALLTIDAGGVDILFHYPPPMLRVTIAVAYLAALLTLVALYFLPRAWRQRSWTLWRKLRHTGVLILMLAVVLLLVEWKVLLAPLSLG